MDFLFSITTNGTIHRLDILDALKEIKDFRHFIVSIVKPNGRGDATLSQIEQNEIISQLFECMDLAKDGFRVRATDVTFFVYDLKNYETIATSGVARSCAFGNSSLHIQTNGNILGCTSCQLSLGNVFEMPENGIRSLWEDNELLNAIRSKEKLTGICGACKYKKFCGGCRCRVYALKDDLFGDDPYCPFVNNVEVHVKKLKCLTI